MWLITMPTAIKLDPNAAGRSFAFRFQTTHGPLFRHNLPCTMGYSTNVYATLDNGSPPSRAWSIDPRTQIASRTKQSRAADPDFDLECPTAPHILADS